ncbi:MAG: response regulator [Anaerocolumna sp.]
MLSILIVDDEKLASADIIYKVSRSGFYFKWVMEASSAEEALDMIREHKPDILLTDIMMGEMNGIDLVRKARNYVPDIVSVLISGYSEFAFAKEAIALGVVDYLLKPVRLEELTGALSKAITKGMHQRNLLQIPANYEKVMDNLLNEGQKEQLFAFLNGMKTNLDFSAAALFPDTVKFFQISIFRLSVNQALKGESGAGNVSKGEKEMERPNFDRLRQQVQDIIREIGGQRFLTFNNFAQSQQITVIAAASNSDFQKAGDALSRNFEEIYRQIHNRLDLILYVGVSQMAESISGALLTQARQALDLRFSLERDLGGRVFYWSEGEKLAAANLPEEDFKLYQSLLAAGDLKQALITVRRIFSSEIPGTAMHIRMLYVELICILARTCIKKAGGSVVSMLGTECLSGGIIDDFSNREELIDSLCRTITAVLSQWMAVTADARSILLIVKSYIENNFTNSELCTNFLSKQFCISLGYLSTSYNKEFGVTITKYIITLRIDYAKKLLKETRLCIGDIAGNCGFNNLSYFMRTFKKQVGCTPNEFR